MKTTKFQKLMQEERIAVVKTFQACYPTKEEFMKIYDIYKKYNQDHPLKMD